MFDARTSQDLPYSPLPHPAVCCMLACSSDDHAAAERLRARSSRESNRCHVRRAIRLKRRAIAGEANARAMAAEVR